MASVHQKSIFLAISVIITLLCSFCETVAKYQMPYYKLPSAIIPTKYHLNISSLIHQNILEYNGSVSIDLTIIEPTNEIVLNSKNLSQFKISLVNLENGLLLETPKLQFKFDEAKDQLRINWPMFPLKLQIGEKYRLNIDFLGNIQKSSVFGFYNTTYLDANKNFVTIATTQFEPTGARLAFPCFDDYIFKANFVISITHGANYTAISNMPTVGDPVLSSTPNGEMATTTFLETPTMSTYLVAFAIINFNKTSVIANGIEHRFFSPQTLEENSFRVLENAIETVDVFEKLLGINYTLHKLDHLYVEKLFGLGMENWGLMTFVEDVIYFDQNDYDKLELLEMIKIENHEIAHQWFGNLVSPASWNYFWLKEGLTTYFSYVASDLVYPEEEIFEYFITKEVWPLNDMYFNHSLTVLVKEGANIIDNVDLLTYKFGASVARMFHHAIGNSTFIKGIHKYLFTFQFSVADEDDFFVAIQAAVDEDNVHLFQNNQSVTKVMRTWTHNVGMPIVTIIRNYETGTITIRQKPKSGEEDQKWWIPINFVTAANPDFERTVADYIMPPQAEVTLDLKDLNISLSNSDWLIVNKQQTGIFLVVYDDLNLKLITEALIENRNKIHRFNRAQILSDLSQTLDGDLDAIEPIFGLLESLKYETEPLPFLGAYNLIINLLSKLKYSSISDKFKTFIFEIIVECNDRNRQRPLRYLTGTQFLMIDYFKRLEFEVDTITCQNYTTEQSQNYFIDETVETEKPCKQSICKGMQNISLSKYIEMFNFLQISKAYKLETTLECVEPEQILIYFYNEVLEKFNYPNYIDKVLITNKFFDTWFTNRVKALKSEEKIDMDTDRVNKYRNDKIMKRDKFVRTYENNIQNWLENYEKNQSQRKFDHSI